VTLSSFTCREQCNCSAAGFCFCHEINKNCPDSGFDKFCSARAVRNTQNSSELYTYQVVKVYLICTEQNILPSQVIYLFQNWNISCFYVYFRFINTSSSLPQLLHTIQQSLPFTFSSSSYNHRIWCAVPVGAPYVQPTTNTIFTIWYPLGQGGALIQCCPITRGPFNQGN